MAMTEDEFSKKLLKIPGISIKPYRGGIAFVLEGRTIMTFWEKRQEAFVKLSPDNQEGLISMNTKGFFPASKSWGSQGWTGIKLEQVKSSELMKAIQLAVGGAIIKD